MRDRVKGYEVICSSRSSLAALHSARSQADLPCDPGSPDRCTHLKEEPLRFTKLALLGGFVARKLRQRGTLAVNQRLEDLKFHLPRESRRFVESCIDRATAFEALRPQENHGQFR
jgi:hypothetical protein